MKLSIHLLLKVFVTILVISQPVMYARAQKRLFNKIEEIGITGGSGIISLRGNEIYEDSRSFLFAQNFGIDVKFKFVNNRFKLGAKVLAEELGGKSERSIERWDEPNLSQETGEQIVTIEMNYVTLPVYVQYYFFDKMNWYLSAGMFGSFFRNGNLLIEEQFPHDFQSHTYQIKKTSNDINLGTTFGIGYRKQFAQKFVLYLELNDRVGFSDVSHQDSTLPTSATARTNVLSLNLSFAILM